MCVYIFIFTNAYTYMYVYISWQLGGDLHSTAASNLPLEVKTYFAEHRERCREIGVDQQPVFPFHIDMEDGRVGRP